MGKLSEQVWGDPSERGHAFIAAIASAVGAVYASYYTVSFEEVGDVGGGPGGSSLQYYGEAFILLATYAGVCLSAMVVIDLLTALNGRNDSKHPAWPYVVLTGLGLYLWYATKESGTETFVPSRTGWLYPPLGIAVAHALVRLYQSGRSP